MKTLELAQAMLAKRRVDRDMKCFGIPIQEFDKEDLITMLAMSLEKHKAERKLHDGTLEMLTACSRRQQILA